MPCEVRIHPGSPAGLDALDVDALALPVFESRTQPRHVSGNVDWRMCGTIARLIQAGSFDGRPLLTPTVGRLGAQRLFMFGLGKPSAVREPQVRMKLEEILGILSDANARSFAVAPPSTPPSLDEQEDAMDLDFAEVLLSAISPRARSFDRVVLLDGGALRGAADQLKGWARDGGLMWSATN
ncbi:MAG: hypothetical protein AAGD10_05195 [Myxococcota bacterium]